MFPKYCCIEAYIPSCFNLIFFVFSTNILVKNVNGISNEKYLFLCNDFNSNKDNILISSEMELKFTINEYIEHIENYDAMLGVDFAEQTSMKKLAYLLD